MANKFQYQLYKDTEKTGRLEMNMFKEASCEGDGFIVHSKLSSKKFPAEDAETLVQFCK